MLLCWAEHKKLEYLYFREKSWRKLNYNLYIYVEKRNLEIDEN